MSSKQQAAKLREDGNELFRNGKYREALHKYNEAIGKDPGDYLSFNNASAALYHLGDFESSLSCATNAAVISPKFAKALWRQGLALMKLNRFREARDVFINAVNVDENDTKPFAEALESCELLLTGVLCVRLLFFALLFVLTVQRTTIKSSPMS